MLRHGLLAFGIVMGFATQISVPGLPVTVGQFALVLWILLSIGRLFAGGHVVITPTLKRFGTFWLAFVLSLCVGTIIGLTMNNFSAADGLHDTLSYILLAIMTCLAAAEPDAQHSLRRSAWWVIGIANFVLALQVGLACGLFSQPGVNPWFWDRFQGWSENPNQLALYCAAFGPLALHLATTTKTFLGRGAGLAALVLPFFVGRLTKSDAYLLTTIMAYLIFISLRLRSVLLAVVNVGLWHHIAALLLVAAIPLTLALAPFGIRESEKLQAFAVGLTRNGERTEETAAIRFRLKDEALKKGLQSASLGLGPGPHLVRPPFTNLFYQRVPFEAHDTILNVYTQGGLAAVLLLVWITGTAALVAWRTKQEALFALVISFAVFAFTHVILRHPIVWFGITLCLVMYPIPSTVRFSAPSLVFEQ